MAEGVLKDPKGVHMVVKDSSDSSRNKKKKNSFKKSKWAKERVKIRASVSSVARKATGRRNALNSRRKRKVCPIHF